MQTNITMLQDGENERPIQGNHRVFRRKTWSHERKPEKRYHRRQRGKRDMDEIHGSVDNFAETGYEDEPEVFESEVKDALRHIKINRKAAGRDDIPIEQLKAGGDEEVMVLTNVRNNVYVWKKEWLSDWTHFSRFTRKETRRNVEITAQFP